MKYIPRMLKEEIKDKYALIGTMGTSEAPLKYKMRKKTIAKNAQIHSFRIENPELNLPHNMPKNKSRKYIKEGIKNLENAFEWGRENFDPLTIDEDFIKTIAGKITPELYEGPIGEYRDRGTTISGATTTPPYSYKVKEHEMPRFIDSLKEKLNLEEPVCKIRAAIYAHMHLARIHPFVDGNGRTSRVLQNIILEHYGFPSPIIESGERNTYYSCLDKAVSDWRNKQAEEIPENNATEGEALFYTFMAGKINISLDKLLGSTLTRSLGSTRLI